MPPAFVLSQDRTLKFTSCARHVAPNTRIREHPARILKRHARQTLRCQHRKTPPAHPFLHFSHCQTPTPGGTSPAEPKHSAEPPFPKQTTNITRRDPAVHNFFCADAFFFAPPRPSRDVPPKDWRMPVPNAHGRRSGAARRRTCPRRLAETPPPRTSVSDSAKETPCARTAGPSDFGGKPGHARRPFRPVMRSSDGYRPHPTRTAFCSRAGPGSRGAAVSRTRSYCADRRRGSSTSLNASPNRLKPNTASVIARPGKIATQGALSANSSAPP